MRPHLRHQESQFLGAFLLPFVLGPSYDVWGFKLVFVTLARARPMPRPSPCPLTLYLLFTLFARFVIVSPVPLAGRSVTCYGSEHLPAAILAWLTIATYCVGYPVVTLVYLWRCRKILHESVARTKALAYFFSNDYRVRVVALSRPPKQLPAHNSSPQFWM